MFGLMVGECVVVVVNFFFDVESNLNFVLNVFVVGGVWL